MGCERKFVETIFIAIQLTAEGAPRVELFERLVAYFLPMAEQIGQS